MEQLTIRMPKEHLIKIEHIAKKMGLKKSDITRIAIQHFVEEQSSQNLTLFEKAQHLIGVAESGISDLGQNHRKYLVRKIRASKE